jgi:hypothetical protein
LEGLGEGFQGECPFPALIQHRSLPQAGQPKIDSLSKLVAVSEVTQAELLSIVRIVLQFSAEEVQELMQEMGVGWTATR